MLKGEDAFRNIWQIQVEPVTIKNDLTKDPILGRYASNFMKKTDQIAEASYNRFVLKGK